MSDPPAPRVLVTRASEDAQVLTHTLAIAGFASVEVPLLLRLWHLEAVAEAALTHPDAAWVVVTSAVTAEVLAAAAPSAWRDARFAAVGPATARRLQELGYTVHYTPEDATGADLVRGLGALEGVQVLYPRAAVTHSGTAEALVAAGADLHEVVAYRNIAPPDYAERLREALPVDATTILSGSAAARLADAISPDERHKLGRVVVIGPSTGRAARDAGLPVHAMARPHTVNGVVRQLKALFPREI